MPESGRERQREREVERERERQRERERERERQRERDRERKSDREREECESPSQVCVVRRHIRCVTVVMADGAVVMLMPSYVPLLLRWE